MHTGTCFFCRCLFIWRFGLCFLLSLIRGYKYLIHLLSALSVVLRKIGRSSFIMFVWLFLSVWRNPTIKNTYSFSYVTFQSRQSISHSHEPLLLPFTLAAPDVIALMHRFVRRRSPNRIFSRCGGEVTDISVERNQSVRDQWDNPRQISLTLRTQYSVAILTHTHEERARFHRIRRHRGLLLLLRKIGDIISILSGSQVQLVTRTRFSG